MATSEKKEVTPLVELPKCPRATASPDPDEYGPIVTIAVGSEENMRKFFTYKGLLAHYSTYFKAAMKEGWKEGISKTIELKDDNPEVFKAFFHWIYTGKLYFVLDASGRIPLPGKLICEIYVFGDARGAPELFNAAINLLFQKSIQEWRVLIYEAVYIYDNTLPESALRKVFVDYIVETHRFRSLVNTQNRAAELEKWPKDLLADIITAFMALGSEPIPSSAGFVNMGFSKANWISHVKPLLCSRYHNHSSSPA